MKTFTVLSAVLSLILMAGGALAHSKTNMTLPADGSVLQAAPDALEMTFDKGMRLTRIVVVDDNGAEFDLDLGGLGGFLTEMSVQMPDLGAGAFVIQWRGLSIDGHAMQDDIRFRVTGE